MGPWAWNWSTDYGWFSQPETFIYNRLPGISHCQHHGWHGDPIKKNPLPTAPGLSPPRGEQRLRWLDYDGGSELSACCNVLLYMWFHIEEKRLFYWLRTGKCWAITVDCTLSVFCLSHFFDWNNLLRTLVFYMVSKLLQIRGMIIKYPWGASFTGDNVYPWWNMEVP